MQNFSYLCSTNFELTIKTCIKNNATYNLSTAFIEW